MDNLDKASIIIVPIRSTVIRIPIPIPYHIFGFFQSGSKTSNYNKASETRKHG